MPNAEEIVRQQCAASLKLVDAAAALTAEVVDQDWCDPHGIPRPMRVVSS